MNDSHQDSDLATLFNAVQPELSDETFTRQVVERIDRASKRILLLRTSIGLGLFAVAAFFALPGELAGVISTFLTAPLLQLESGSFSWLFMPINNLGALLLVMFKCLRMLIARTSGRRVTLLPF